jgi:hypothetical protein
MPKEITAINLRHNLGAVADRVSYGAGFVVGALGAAMGTVALALGESRRTGRPVAVVGS